MTAKKMPKNAEFFICEKCNFTCSKKSNYEKHLLTRKHQILTNTYKKMPKNAEHLCTCGKSYKHRQSLSNHKKKCLININLENGNFENIAEMDEEKNGNTNNIKITEISKEETVKDITQEDSTSVDYKEMFIEMMHQNRKLQNQLVELIPQVKGNTTNNTMNNNFNINLFLNEQCKDALNIMDFVNSLSIEMADLERTGSNGFADGITNIFVKAIQDLDVTKRPIHCTDLKREILYVKDNETWNRDTEDKDKMKTAINTIKQNNIRKITEWINENPESQEVNNPKNDVYMNILQEHTGNSNQEKNLQKVIKNVAKNVLITKDDKT